MPGARRPTPSRKAPVAVTSFKLLAKRIRFVVVVIVVVQDSVSWGFQIVELARACGAHEGPDRGDAQGEGKREKDVDHGHGAASLGGAKVRIHSAMPSTVNEATGIRMAACRALTTPVTASAAAMRL